LADEFLAGIYGSVSPNIFWAPERVLDDESLTIIKNMGYSYVFADQMRHFLKWFGRSAALGTGVAAPGPARQPSQEAILLV